MKHIQNLLFVSIILYKYACCGKQHIVTFDSSIYQFQEFLFIHDFICQIFTIIKQCICCNWRWNIFSLFFPCNMNHFEWNIIFFRCLFYNGNIFCIERALVCIVKNVSTFIHSRMFCTFHKLWFFYATEKR